MPPEVLASPCNAITTSVDAGSTSAAVWPSGPAEHEGTHQPAGSRARHRNPTRLPLLPLLLSCWWIWIRDEKPSSCPRPRNRHPSSCSKRGVQRGTGERCPQRPPAGSSNIRHHPPDPEHRQGRHRERPPICCGLARRRDIAGIPASVSTSASPRCLDLRPGNSNHVAS